MSKKKQETYDDFPKEKWLNGLAEQSKHNSRHILSLFSVYGIPESYLDVGCGDGTMVRTARLLGVRAYGVDQLVDESWGEGFFHANLVDKFVTPAPVRMVTSFEVGEHIHESAHATFCDTLTESLDKSPGAMLVFSAARPGQGGTGHIACRPAEYWHNQFILRGLSYNSDATLRMAHIWSQMNSPLNYLWDNLMVFST